MKAELLLIYMPSNHTFPLRLHASVAVIGKEQQVTYVWTIACPFHRPYMTLSVMNSHPGIRLIGSNRVEIRYRKALCFNWWGITEDLKTAKSGRVDTSHGKQGTLVSISQSSQHNYYYHRVYFPFYHGSKRSYHCVFCMKICPKFVMFGPWKLRKSAWKVLYITWDHGVRTLTKSTKSRVC